MSKVITALDPTVKYSVYKILNENGVVVIPTDTIYGVSASYNSPIAIDKIYAIKKRRKEKALPILIGDISQINLVAKNIPENANKLIEAFWPGALTIILPRQETLPSNLSEYDSVGIRMPNLPFTLDLLKFCGPMATTSANISGGENPTSILDVLVQLRHGVDLYVNGGRTAGDIASTVVDCTSSEVKILREGVISKEQIYDALK